MVIFIFKTLAISIAIIFIFKFSIGPILNQALQPVVKLYEFTENKKKRIEIKEKILNELDNANKKDRYLTKEEAKILSTFLKKISDELK